VPREVFSSRYLIIYDESGERLLQEVYFTQIGNGATGYYTAQIALGTYVVDTNHLGIDTPANLPVKITVSADETVTIDVNIDIGTR
jgi:acetyltransferase-like isoleucine patch superfamily enzyme